MRKAPLSLFFGPALVLYLVADLASVRGAPDLVGMLIATAALLGSLSGLGVVKVRDRMQHDRPGARRVGLLGVALGLALVRWVDPTPMRLGVDLIQVAGFCAAGALLVDLSLRVPDWPSLRAKRVLLALNYGVALLALTLEALSLLPPPTLLGHTLVVPPLASQVALGWLASASIIAWTLRLLRKPVMNTAQALAENGWALIGLWPVMPALLVVSLTAAARMPLPSAVQHVTVALAALALVESHRRLVDAQQRVRVGRSMRLLVTTLLALAVSFLVGGFMMMHLPGTFYAGGLLALCSAGLFLLAFLPLRDPVTRLLAPAHGRLLRALDPTHHAQVTSARRLEVLAASVLVALRQASGDREPRLCTLDPALEALIDAAGTAHVRKASMHPALLQALRANPDAPILRKTLEAQHVRRPQLRPLIDALVEPDLLCVVPLVVEGDLEGALLVPRGPRRSALSLEEIDALMAFAALVAGPVSMLCAEARAHQRVGETLAEVARLRESDRQLQESVARLQADALVLRAGRMAHRMQESPVAYSPAMRRLLARLTAEASGRAPILLEAEGGTPLDVLGFHVHRQSGRAEEAFVVGDCAVLSAEQAMAALFGEPTKDHAPGLLQLAAGGTLLLLDVPALPRDVQAALSHVIETGQAPALGEREARAVDVRIIAAARVNLRAAASADRFDPVLAEQLCAYTVFVPPLRERPEDLESLLLLAIARACHVHGRSPVGMDADARQVLLTYHYPGNQGELRSIIERAVARCQGTRITLEDLPTLSGPSPNDERSLAFTFDTIERAALLQALIRSKGNKTEAARMLGMKRSTFLDKVRRHQLDDGDKILDA